MHQEWLANGLLHVDGIMSKELSTLLDSSSAKMGHEAVACYIEYFPHHPRQEPFVGVVAYKDKGKLVVETYPVRVADNTITCKGKSLQIEKGAPSLFLMTTWLARTVFQVPPAFKPIPLQLNAGHQDSLANTLKKLDVAVWTQFKNMDTSLAGNIIDMLHSYGLVYIGSLTEWASTEESGAISAIVDDTKNALYWIEDATVFEDNGYDLVLRFQKRSSSGSSGDSGSGSGSGDGDGGGGKSTAWYITRRLVVTDDGTRLCDTESKKLSPPFVIEAHRPPTEGLSAFSDWVHELLLPMDDCMITIPYLRDEIVGRFLITSVPPSTHMPTRPFLVNGRLGNPFPLFPLSSPCPPRLLFSPDLFFSRGRIPPGMTPTTIHYKISFKSWQDDPLFQMFLKIDGERSHIYKIIFPDDTKGGVRVPEVGQLRTYVKTATPQKLSEDSIALSILRPRTRDEWGTEIVEFTLTTYHRSASLCVNTLLCDFKIQATLFPYDASKAPRVYKEVAVPVFSTEVQKVRGKLAKCTLERAIRALVGKHHHKRVYTSIFEMKVVAGKHHLFYWDGLEFEPLQTF
jgi:hypothetical protein